MTDREGVLPRWVYWRRRAAAVAGSVVVLLVLAGLLGLLHEHDQPDARGAAQQSSSTPPTPTAEPTSASSSGVPASPSGSAAPGSASPSSAVSPAPAAMPVAPPPLPPSPPPPPGPPPPCPDAAIRLTAETDRPVYRAGERPQLRIVVVNAGNVACVRDVSRRLRELVVTSVDGRSRLWSSKDCYADDSDGVRLLQPGERLDFDVTWARRTSAPGCPAGRDAVRDGDYLLVARLGGLASPPALFRLD